MKRLNYLFFRLAVACFTYLPFSIIYKLSDGLSYVLYHFIGYRKKVVLQNLNKAFPNKTKEEINLITRNFYRHFTDLVLESFKAFSMSGEDLVKRYEVVNPGLIDAYYEAKQDVLVLGSHFCNWEWGVMCVPLQCKHRQIGIYKPIANEYINQYMAKSRSQFGMQLASIKQTSATFKAQQAAHTTSVVIMIADQSPSNSWEAYWLNFLNQDTACLHGPEKYARQTNWPVVYFHTQRVARGYYKMELKELVKEPLALNDGEVTKAYMQYLEKRIKQKPENWLWSHKRWKKKRPKLAGGKLKIVT